MRSKSVVTALIVAAGLAASCLAGASGARAQSGSPAPASGADASGGVSPAQKYFTDTILVNQDGKELRFYSDLLKGRVVIINTFFTNCTSVCPPMTRTLERIQEWLGDRMGKDVFILSLSVDPLVDTPPKLKVFADSYHAKPGWHFLAGSKENVQLVLRKLGQFVEARDNHSTILILGNDRTGLWKKAFGLAKASDLIEVVDSVLDDTGAAKQETSR
jgi:protein SCO1/2